jgi:SAM-dependent methyltransferase
MDLFVDRVHRLPRMWSNEQLAAFAPLFDGDVANVSAWKDVDKEGERYENYFTRAASYTITNYHDPDARGQQGFEDEILLDLTEELPGELVEGFDVVFNHTTLEHIYDFQKAFRNLCRMTKDVLILVVPWMQKYHSDYGDYWRFSPLAVKAMVEEHGMSLEYLSFNSHADASVYVFAIASKQPQRWVDEFEEHEFSLEDPSASGHEPYAGAHLVRNYLFRISKLPRRVARRLLKPFW